jgi:hypothetical protein
MLAIYNEGGCDAGRFFGDRAAGKIDEEPDFDSG